MRRRYYLGAAQAAREKVLLDEADEHLVAHAIENVCL